MEPPYPGIGSKNGCSGASELRPVALNSHASKVFARIVLQRAGRRLNTRGSAQHNMLVEDAKLRNTSGPQLMLCSCPTKEVVGSPWRSLMWPKRVTL